MRRIVDLLGTDISITTRCWCPRVAQFSAALLVQRFGAAATVDITEARLRCPTCRHRPALVFWWSWTNSFGLGRGVGLPQVPEWAGLTSEMAPADAQRAGQ